MRALEGCDGILHVAGTFDPGPGGIALMESLHVDATRTLLRARARAGIARFVLCSSSITVGFGPLDAPGDENSPLDADAIYGRRGALRAYHDTKLQSEQDVAEAGGVIVNPDFVLGAWDVKPTSGQLLLSLGKGWVPVHPRGGKCFVDADDCAAGHLGRRKSMVAVPDLALRAAGVLGGLLQRADAHRFAGLDPYLLLAMQQERYRSGRRAQEELGVPVTPLEVTVEKAWRWFRDHGYA